MRRDATVSSPSYLTGVGDAKKSKKAAGKRKSTAGDEDNSEPNSAADQEELSEPESASERDDSADEEFDAPKKGQSRTQGGRKAKASTGKAKEPKQKKAINGTGGAEKSAAKQGKRKKKAEADAVDGDGEGDEAADAPGVGKGDVSINDDIELFSEVVSLVCRLQLSSPCDIRRYGQESKCGIADDC